MEGDVHFPSVGSQGWWFTVALKSPVCSSQYGCRALNVSYAVQTLYKISLWCAPPVWTTDFGIIAAHTHTPTNAGGMTYRPIPFNGRNVSAARDSAVPFILESCFESCF